MPAAPLLPPLHVLTSLVTVTNGVPVAPQRVHRRMGVRPASRAGRGAEDA
jgi:hypothetical protein